MTVSVPFLRDSVKTHDIMKKANKHIVEGFITKLSRCEIFVFGSNLEGQHLGGAARIAYDKFGAVWGQGVGPQGQCYAIPTMHGPLSEIKPYVDEFLQYAKDHPQNRFLLTRVGCGIAGFKDEDMAKLFAEALDIPNIAVPEEWLPALVYWCAPKSDKVPSPKVIDENILKALCEENKYIIGAGLVTELPTAKVRYTFGDGRFNYVNFGDYFFYGMNFYVFGYDDSWASEHLQNIVLDYFRDECWDRGYCRKAIFAGVRTGLKDSKGEDIYTGDICHIKRGGAEYHFPLSTFGTEPGTDNGRYAFVLDNHCLFPEQCDSITIEGNVFANADIDAFPETVGARCFQYLFPDGIR